MFNATVKSQAWSGRRGLSKELHQIIKAFHGPTQVLEVEFAACPKAEFYSLLARATSAELLLFISFCGQPVEGGTSTLPSSRIKRAGAITFLNTYIVFAKSRARRIVDNMATR
jgi:hypothetical protein